jgi:hypothetical protein
MKVNAAIVLLLVGASCFECRARIKQTPEKKRRGIWKAEQHPEAQNWVFEDGYHQRRTSYIYLEVGSLAMVVPGRGSERGNKDEMKKGGERGKGAVGASPPCQASVAPKAPSASGTPEPT